MSRNVVPDWAMVRQGGTVSPKHNQPHPVGKTFAKKVKSGETWVYCMGCGHRIVDGHHMDTARDPAS